VLVTRHNHQEAMKEVEQRFLARAYCSTSSDHLEREPMHPSTPELRRQWRKYWQDSDKHFAEWRARGYSYPPPPPRPPMPQELAEMTCGARTRAGTPCKRRDLYRSGRCALHGGLSTGPRKSWENAEESQHFTTPHGV
jgi:hypothetical protein